MSYTKKTLVMFLVSALLGGGAWYLNTVGVFGEMASSVFGTTFVCSEENLKKQAGEYRKTLIQKRKADSYREELEKTITSLRDAGKVDEMEQQQKSLRVLIR